MRRDQHPNRPRGAGRHHSRSQLGNSRTQSPVLPDAGDDCAWLAAHLQSLTFQTLGVILISNMRCRARIADGKARAQAALGHAALCTFGHGSSSRGHRLSTCGDGSYARVLIASTGHRPRSAPQPQAPQRCHRPRAQRLHRLHRALASQRSSHRPLGPIILGEQIV